MNQIMLLAFTILIIFVIYEQLRKNEELKQQYLDTPEEIIIEDKITIKTEPDQFKQVISADTDTNSEKLDDKIYPPKSTTLLEKLSKLKDNIITNFNETKQVDDKPLTIIKSKQVISQNDTDQGVTDNYMDKVKSDIISPNPEGSTEYYFVDEDSSNAWTEINVSQHPTYHTSSIRSELTNTGAFFDNRGLYHDKTSPYSENNLPDRCLVNENNQVLCDYNNKLYIIPPKLIQNPEDNPLLNSINNEGIYNKVKTDTSQVTNLNNNSYRTWEYENEKDFNGGVFFNSIKASESSNESYLSLNSFKDKKTYSF